MDSDAIVRRIVGILNGPKPGEVKFPWSPSEQEQLDNLLANLVSRITCGDGTRTRVIHSHKSANGPRNAGQGAECVDVLYNFNQDHITVKVPALPLGQIAAVADDFPRYREGSSSRCRPPTVLFSRLESLRFDTLLRRYEAYLCSDKVVTIADHRDAFRPESVRALLGDPVEHSTVEVKCKSRPLVNAAFINQHAFWSKSAGGGILVKMLSSVLVREDSTISTNDFFSYGSDRATFFFGIHDVEKRILGNTMKFQKYELPDTIFPILLKEDVSLMRAYVDVDDHEFAPSGTKLKRWVIEENDEKKQGMIIECCDGKVWRGRSKANKYGLVMNSADPPPNLTLDGEKIPRHWIEVQEYLWPKESFETRHLLKMSVKVMDSDVPLGCFIDDSSAFRLSEDSWLNHMGVWLRLKNNATALALFARDSRRTVFWGDCKPQDLDVDLSIVRPFDDALKKFKALIQGAHSLPVTLGIDFDYWKEFEEYILIQSSEKGVAWIFSRVHVILFFRLDSETIQTHDVGGNDKSLSVMEELIRINKSLKQRESWLLDVCALTETWNNDQLNVDAVAAMTNTSELPALTALLRDHFELLDDIALPTDQLRPILRNYYLGSDASPPSHVFSGSYTVWTTPMTELLESVKHNLSSEKLMFLKLAASQKGAGVTTALRSVAMRLQKEMHNIKPLVLLSFPSSDDFRILGEWFCANDFLLIVDRKGDQSADEQGFCRWLFSLPRKNHFGCVVGSSDLDRWIEPSFRKPLSLNITPFWTREELKDYCKKLAVAFDVCPARVFHEAQLAITDDPSTRHFFLFAFAASNGEFKPAMQWIKDAQAALGSSGESATLIPAHHPRRVFDVLAFVGAVCPKDCGLALRDSDCEVLFAKRPVRVLLRTVQHTVTLYQSDRDRWVGHNNRHQKRSATFLTFVHPFFARCHMKSLPHELDWNGITQFYGFVKEDLIQLLMRSDKDESDYVVEKMFSDGTTLLQRMCRDWREFESMATDLHLDVICRKVAVSKTIRKGFRENIKTAVQLSKETLDNDLQYSYLLLNNYAMCLSTAWHQTKEEKYVPLALKQFESLFKERPEDPKVIKHAYRLCKSRYGSDTATWPPPFQEWAVRYETSGFQPDVVKQRKSELGSYLMWAIF